MKVGTKRIAQSRDLRLARSEVESRKAELLNRKKALSEASRNLEIIIGRYPSSTISADILPGLPPKPILGSPEDVLKNRQILLVQKSSWNRLV